MEITDFEAVLTQPTRDCARVRSGDRPLQRGR